ncbi:MAG: PEGA domain-containing protein, partial [Polyangiaceae bacterium]|nr:PEGA domain-containing protein [Polyangiaceae bacterium]
MDWDDEDEKTNIYDKVDGPQPSGRPLPAAGAPISKLGSAAALAAGSGGAAAMAPPPPAPLPRPAPITVPPAPLPPAATPPARSSGRADPTQVLKPQQASSGRGGLLAALAVLGIAGAAAAFFVLQPKQGTVVVAVKSGGRPLSAVDVFVGEKKVCTSVPCTVPHVDKGTVTVKAVASGYEPGSELVAVRAGEDSPITIELAKGRDSADAASAAKGTGFKVTGPAHVKVAIDGKELGPLPQEKKDLSPGEHKIKFFSSDRYKVDERTVSFAENEVKDLGAIKLPVVKGKATLTLETQAALVTLVSGTERKAVRTFPISLDIDTSKTWTVEATRPGYIDFRQAITFDDEAEKTITIVLMKKGEKKDDDKKTPDKKDPPAAESGTATLSINSIPPSNCILDGRPLGSTPKAGVSVPAGTHSVVFVHPEHGRKSVSVTVKAGESKSVGVRF